MSKRTAAAKQRIQQFYFQLIDGCGQPNCSNPDCASNKNFVKLNSDTAAARAMILFKNKAMLCEKSPSKVPRTDSCEEEALVNNGNSSFQTKHDLEKLNSFSSAESEEQECKPSHSETSNIDDSKLSEISSNVLTQTMNPIKDYEEKENALANNNLVDANVSCRKLPSNGIIKNLSCKKISNADGDIEHKLLNIDKLSACDDNISKKLENIFVSEPPNADQPQTLTIEEAFALFDSHNDNTSIGKIKEFLWKIFSSPSNLNKFALMKEELKSQQSVDEDKDINEADGSLIAAEKPNMDDLDDADDLSQSSSEKVNFHQNLVSTKLHITVDMERVKLLYPYFSKYQLLTTVLLNAIAYLTNEVERHLIISNSTYLVDPNYLNMFVIIMENPVVFNPEAFDTVFPKFCKVLSRLPPPGQATLARYWSKSDENHLRNLVENLQQLITIKIVSESNDIEVHLNESIAYAAKCLNLLFYASILGGKIDREIDISSSTASKLLQEKVAKSDGMMDFIESSNNDHFSWVDPLAKELDLNRLDSVRPLVPLSEFINEPLNDVIKIDKDYANFKINQQGSPRFSFLHFPFLLNTENKTTHLFYDNRITMYSERRRTFVSSLMQGELIHPYLRLNVRRNHIIEDALIQLEYASVKDFKKQLFVEFDKEEGVDEGGVSKEFFQLIIDEIFNPENGVFKYDEDTRLFWFNSHSFETLTQYKLIGIVFGLAIYNNCILDVNFPSFVYKKLLGRKARFIDMENFQPILYKSLKELLEYEGNVEEDLMLTYRIEYDDVFGNVHNHDLKEDGENIPVTKENRQEYVDMYADWLLNTSVAEQFNQFLCGFDLVVCDSPLKYLFDHQELELLIRGSEDYDFSELERTTDYDGGFNKASQTIVDFWSVVHELSEQEKRSLLQFSTGSDRAPVGGLAKLKMIIARNGPDSNRLPTAHTCFNVILLPDYKNREKLKERLLKSIKYSKGFGML